MAYSTEERKQLLAVTAPRRKETIRAALDYMSRTGLSATDFARRLRTRGGSSYSRTTLNLFLNEKYHKISSDDSAICQAVEDFLAANPIEPCSRAEGRLYETQDVVMIRQHLYDALEYRRAYYLRGAPGTQKSFASEYLTAEITLREIPKNGNGARVFYIYCTENMRPTELMQEVAIAAGSLAAGSTRRIIRNLRFDLGRRKVAFLFDESQHLDVHCLETLRELHDRDPRCGMLFLGSHELEKTFNRLDMEQWRSRIHHGADLPGVSRDEAKWIINSEIGKEAAEEKIEFPKGSGKRMPRETALLDSSMATDLHKGRTVTYLNARTLFRALQGYQARKRSKGATT
jgi:hypothetical protein